MSDPIGKSLASRTTNFGEADKYDKVRPKYPACLFDDIFRYVQASGKRALEIGAGTGKATSPFLDNGYDVTAVESSESMAAFLQAKFEGNKHFRVHVSDFENSVLGEDFYDLVYSATAFHWVDTKIGCPKAFRILKNGGTFALFRNTNVPTIKDSAYEEIQKCYEMHYRKPYVKPIKKAFEEFARPAEINRAFGFSDLAEYGFEDILTRPYSATRKFSADEYIALLDTFSDHRSLPEADRAALYKGIRDIILSHGGYHKVNYVFQLHMGRKPCI